MRFSIGRGALSLLLLAVLAALLLVACDQNEPLPTVAPAEATLPPPAAPISPQPTLPPPAIISVPVGEAATSAFSVPTGNGSSQVIIQAGAAGSALPEGIQHLLDDLASGALILNSSPAGPGGQPVRYAYRDINGDGGRDLVIVVVAEPVNQQAAPGAAEPASEEVQAIGINLEELLASINLNPNAPLVRSAFVYTLSEQELEEAGGR